jgi:hypothetical protein
MDDRLRVGQASFDPVCRRVSAWLRKVVSRGGPDSFHSYR